MADAQPGTPKGSNSLSLVRGMEPAPRHTMLAATGSIPISGTPLALAVTETSTLCGLDAHPISVEAICTRGPAFFQMVGLAHAAVREARVRVAGALSGLNILLDEHAVTVNLAPADLRKSDAALDVAIAVALLQALGHVPPGAADGVLLLGELSLDGRLQPVRGVLPLLEGARRRGVQRVIVPSANATEAGLSQAKQVHSASHLSELVHHLSGLGALPRVPSARLTLDAGRKSHTAHDLCHVVGQSAAKRALEIAAAGAHHLILVGPPGGGKTLLARRLPGILPPLTREEAVECTALHSVAGALNPQRGAVEHRPFRAPHHSVSGAALVGGGELPKPGEISLAHHGVLFLDEFAEFQRSALEALRQPLEDGIVHISRARASARFPARPLLVAATNPCRCGYAGHPKRHCRCSASELRRYQARLSGPILDRIDLHVPVSPCDFNELSCSRPAEDSSAVRRRVLAARKRQQERQRKGEVAAHCNAQLTLSELREVARLGPSSRKLLHAALDELGLSTRAYEKVLRLSRTIADLSGEETVGVNHVAEAIQSRLLDRSPRE